MTKQRREGAEEITVGDAHNMLLALLMLDRDESMAFEMETRLAIAININALQPVGQAYEKSRVQKDREIFGNTHAMREEEARRLTGDPHKLPENEARQRADRMISELRDAKQFDFLEANEALREKKVSLNLRKIAVSDLNLEENKKIRSQTVAWLAPILTGLDD